MTNEVLLALIALIKEWGSLIIPTVGTIVVMLMQRWSNKKSEARSEVVQQQIAAVQDAAVLSDAHTDLIAKGSERKGVEIGVEIGVEKERVRQSDQATLRAAFQAESTDVFMARTDGPDQNHKR